MIEIKCVPKLISTSYILNESLKKKIKYFFFILLNKYNVILFNNSLKIIKAKNTFFDIFLFGLIKGFKIYLEIHGTGYKFRLINTKTLFGLILRIGYSHLLLINLIHNFRLSFFNKSSLCFYTNDLWYLNNNLYCLSIIKKKNNYKKKGIYWKNAIYTLKKSKK